MSVATDPMNPEAESQGSSVPPPSGEEPTSGPPPMASDDPSNGAFGASSTDLAEFPPPPPAPAASGSAFLLTIGDIGVTSDTIVTANGNAPLAGSQWILTDRTQTEQKIPTWAIVMAIIFAAACLLGLFFLLIKETRITGYAEVSVRSGSLSHMTQLPVNNPNDIARYRAMVAQAQSLAASSASPHQ